jgi:hypothetical protein
MLTHPFYAKFARAARLNALFPFFMPKVARKLLRVETTRVVQDALVGLVHPAIPINLPTNVHNGQVHLDSFAF